MNEPNLILLAMVLLATIAGIGRTIAGPGVKAGRGWLMVCVLIVFIAGLSYVLIPQRSGYIAAGLWCVLIGLPSIGANLAQRLVGQQRYVAAQRVASLIRLLHPADGWREQPELIRALDLGQRGELDAAEAILRRHNTAATPIGRYATGELFRVRGQWAELRAWIEVEIESGRARRDPASIVTYLRALAETGDLHQLVLRYREFMPLLRRSRLLPTMQIVVAAFCGRRSDVERLCADPLKHFPLQLRHFWLAIADLAAGNNERGRQQLTELLSSDHNAIRCAAERRLQSPPVLAASILGPDMLAVLDQCMQQSEHEQRFGPWGNLSRAYATYLLILLTALMFGLEVTGGGSTNARTLYYYGALWPNDVIAGAWWRLIAAQFLHYGVAHLLLNMVGLLLLGPFLERRLGRKRYLAVYLGSGLLALSTVVVMTQLRLLPAQLLVGASGGIMGLAGATGALMLYSWRREAAMAARRRLVGVIVIVVLQAISDLFIIIQASFVAHLAGAICGFLLLATYISVRMLRGEKVKEKQADGRSSAFSETS